MKLKFSLVLILFLSNFNKYHDSQLQINLREKLIQNITYKTYSQYSFDKVFLNPDGCFSDINYFDRSNTKWSPIIHLKRTLFYLKSSEDINKEDKINLMLGCFTSKNISSNNWWWNDIETPHYMLLILLTSHQKQLTINENYTDIFIRDYNVNLASSVLPKHTDIANKLDLIKNNILFSIFINSKYLLSRSIVKFEHTLMTNDDSGLMEDFSFHAHQNNLYIHTYGTNFVLRAIDIINTFKRSDFEIDINKYINLLNFIKCGYLKSIYNGYVDYSALGRGVARANKTHSVPEQYNKILSFLEQHESYIQNECQTSNTNFYLSDYMIHRSDNMMASVRASSSTVSKVEWGNGENLKGHGLTEGILNFYIHGSEFHNIFPIWDWSKLPGTTLPSNILEYQRPEWGGNYANSSVTGGLSDGDSGVFVYGMNDFNTSANKSWFFIDDFVIALGSKIRSDTKVYTTVNQLISKSNIVIDNKIIRAPNINLSLFNKKNLHITHNDISYFFPKGVDLELSQKRMSGSWNDINLNSNSKLIYNDVFKVYISHEKNDDYAYIVSPKVDSVDIFTKRFNIVNNDDVHLVYDNLKNSIYIAFFDEGSLKDEFIDVSSDGPILLKYNLLDCSLYYSNPSSNSSANVIIDSEKFSLNNYFNLIEFDYSFSTTICSNN